MNVIYDGGRWPKGSWGWCQFSSSKLLEQFHAYRPSLRVARRTDTCREESTSGERGEEERNCTCSCNCSGRAAHASFDKILYRPREALNRENCIQWPTSRKEVIGLARPERLVSALSVVELRDVIVARITTFARCATKLDSWLSW